MRRKRAFIRRTAIGLSLTGALASGLLWRISLKMDLACELITISHVSIFVEVVDGYMEPILITSGDPAELEEFADFFRRRTFMQLRVDLPFMRDDANRGCLPWPYQEPFSLRRFLRSRFALHHLGMETLHYRRVVFPLWAPFFLCLFLPAVWFMWFIGRSVRRHRRRRRDLCPNCGYNLTGNTSGVCPECGEPIEHVRGTIK
ncbi:MAG: hypothetical protein GY842_27130 [bacterium]|nr:hypothetical protein [bacterium]